MKLKEGMYVRRKNGEIGIIKNLKKYYNSLQFNEEIYSCLLFKNSSYPSIVRNDDIIKASFNIIDLIEIGDYVNGVEVEEINDKEIMLVDTHLWIDKEVVNRLIKSIVTKEQFNSMKYEVGE